MKGKTQTKRNVRGGGDGSETFAAGSSTRKGTVIKTYRAKSRSRSRSRVSRTQDSDDDSVLFDQAKVKAKPMSKSKSKKAAESGSDVEDVRPGPSAKKVPTTPKPVPSRKRRIGISSDTEGDDEGLAKTPKKVLVRQLSQASTVELDKDGVELTAFPAPPRTPRRRASVLLSTLAEIRSASQSQVEPSASVKPSTKEQVEQTGSNDMRAKDAPQKTPKRGRPPTRKAPKQPVYKDVSPSPESSRKPSPSPLPKAKRGRRSIVAAPEAGPSRVEEPPVVHRRRSAATKAAQKLHDEVMPDLVNYQKELKSGHVKSAYEGHQSPDKTKGKDKDKEQQGLTKGRKRVSLDGPGEGDEDEREAKKRKTGAGTAIATKGKGKEAGGESSEEEEIAVESPKKRGRPVSKGKATTQPRFV